MVGAVGFEPTTSWSRTKRATKLRYAPTTDPYYPTAEQMGRKQFRAISQSSENTRIERRQREQSRAQVLSQSARQTSSGFGASVRRQ